MTTRRPPHLLLALLVLACLALPSVAAGSPEAADSTASTGQVDINTAGIEELQSLPGIGPSLAQRIVDHRREHGPFRRVEDLLEIKGIGERSLDRMRDRITVSKASKG